MSSSAALGELALCWSGAAAQQRQFRCHRESEARIAEARAAGYLCLCGDSASEDMLIAAGVKRAHALASCLANDALNILVTLTARALNPDILIVARGDKPTRKVNYC